MGAGRRITDHIDPLIEMRIQEVVADTRHRVLDEVATLATNQATAAIQATKEHGEVRTEIAGVRNEVEGLRRDLADLPELTSDVEALKLRGAADDARTAAIDKLRAQQRWTLTFVVAAVPVALLVAPHIH